MYPKGNFFNLMIFCKINNVFSKHIYEMKTLNFVDWVFSSELNYFLDWNEQLA